MNEKQERETAILDRLTRDGAVSVAQLAAELGVSAVTIRGQLSELETQGLLVRTHGGAKPILAQSVLDRQRDHEDAKQRISRAAADLIEDNDRVMIEAGTTTALVAKYVARRHVQVVTNSMLLFNYARLNPSLDVVLTGGNFHRLSESMVGPMALRAVQEFNVRLAFVGTDGFTIDRGMTTQFFEGAQVISAMAERAESIWLLADSSKYGRAGFVSVLPLEKLTGIITDTGIADRELERLRDHVAEVRVV